MLVRKILYPTDFSEASRHALEAALFCAELFDAELVAQYVLVFRNADLWAPEAHFPNAEELFEKLHELASSDLGALTRGQRDRPLRVREVIDRAPEAVRGILDRAEAEPADLIVLGTHGRTGAAHLLLGSVAAEVLRRSPCPVLTVPASAGSRSLGKLRRILAADDFSAPARRALQHAAVFARRVGAELDLVHVLGEVEMPLPPGGAPVAWGASFVEELLPHARQALADDRDRYAAGLAGRDLVLRGGGAGILVDHLKTAEVDLVVQGTQGRRGLDRLLLGSFAERMARLSPCPVLTIPAGEAARADSG